MKSFNPAPFLFPTGGSGVSVTYVWAGSHPITMLLSGFGGVLLKKERANAGKDVDKGVGGCTKW
jgi:hypothetical protein